MAETKVPVSIPISQLHPYKNSPYKVKDDLELFFLADSIGEYGVLTPLIVRPLENTEKEYEVVSGHRRLYAAKKAGITEVPVFVQEMDKDDAAILLVDSNAWRGKVLPSENAFACKLKAEAMTRKGLIPDKQMQRYVRLTHLIPELLDKLDHAKLAVPVGVELSFLTPETQRTVLDVMDYRECVPTHGQAAVLKRLQKFGDPDEEQIEAVLDGEKPALGNTLCIPAEKLRKYLPEGLTVREMEEYVLKRLKENPPTVEGGEAHDQ